MRLLLTILLLPFFAAATNYYVDNAGSDALAGTSTAAAWQTISKVNAFSFSAGDSIFFKRGGTWREKLVPPTAGVYFGAYGSGLKPVITGLKTVSSFSQSGNIWTATISDATPYPVVVMVNGRLEGKARMPNTGWTYGTAANQYWVKTGAATPNYVGAELVHRTREWINDVLTITSQNVDTLFTPFGTTYTNPLGFYFFQNHDSFLDLPGEWTLDTTTKVLKVYATSQPTVKYTTIDTLVHIRKKNNITFENLTFEGANSIALYGDTSNYITAKSCTFRYTGGTNRGGPNCYWLSGVSGGHIMLRNSKGCTFNNDSLLHSLNNGVQGYYGSDSLTVSDCFLQNAGMISGLAASSEGAAIGMFVQGNGTNIANNRFDSTGYNGIYFQGAGTQLTQNFFTNFCMRKQDGGAIYSYGARSLPMSLVRKNIVIGNAGSQFILGALYLDINTNYVLVDSNTLYGGGQNYTFPFSYLDHIYIKENTLFDSSYQMFFNGPGAPGNVFEVKKNIIVQLRADRPAFYSQYSTGNGTIDSNYVQRPKAETNYYSLSSTSFFYTKAEFNSITGWGINDVGSPSVRTSNSPQLVYNPTKIDSTISFSGRRVSAKGEEYQGSITLKPFTSAVLYPMASPPAATNSGNIHFRFKKINQL